LNGDKVATEIIVRLADQRLDLLKEGRPSASYAISTAANGAGEEQGSGCTPRGRHRIRIKIGAGEPENAVFVSRRPTGEIYTPDLAARYPERDWVLTVFFGLPVWNRAATVAAAGTACVVLSISTAAPIPNPWASPGPTAVSACATGICWSCLNK
jgi:hypothetical protein